MQKNLGHESLRGDNTALGTKAGKRPYQSPTVCQLAHSLAKGGAVYDPDEDAKYGPSGGPN